MVYKQPHHPYIDSTTVLSDIMYTSYSSLARNEATDCDPEYSVIQSIISIAVGRAA